MKSSRSLIGLPVLVLSRVAGHVTDIALDLKLKRLTGVYMAARPIGMRFIALDDIEIIGDVCIIAKNKGVRAKPAVNSDIRALRADGQRIGRITGALIDEKDGGIQAVELSNGLWEDLLSGRRWVFNYASGTNVPGVFINPEGGVENE